MVPNTGPGVDGLGAGCRQGSHPRDKVSVIPVLPEEGRPLDPPHHDVVEDAGAIEARVAGHGAENTRSRLRGNVQFIPVLAVRPAEELDWSRAPQLVARGTAETVELP